MALLEELGVRMDGTMESLKKEFTGVRTGRASTSLLEPIHVEAYGSHMMLSQVATVSAPEARMLTVQVWDRGMVKAVEKAIADAHLGLNPQTEGQLIRVPLPQLTQERRAELAKAAHKYAEQAKVAVRNVRRDGMDAIKKPPKDVKYSEDEQKKMEVKVQELTDQYIKKIDDLAAHKEKEIMQV